MVTSRGLCAGSGRYNLNELFCQSDSQKRVVTELAFWYNLTLNKKKKINNFVPEVFKVGLQLFFVFFFFF